ncbi:MAG TPA: methyltransferase [Candidatus Limnocylindrales bacterium]|jgi:phospholipid N-methyltransferase|nr:methyltransferase [Candidatus Limnocylindrales bacterium]
MPKLPLSAGYLHFFWAGIARHLKTGSIFPSQRFLVEKMIKPIPTDYAGRVVELGSGNGTLTVRLATKCPKAQVVACEIDPVLAEDTRKNLFRAGINGQVRVRAQPAQDVLRNLVASSEEKPGYIISGLPIGNLRRTAVLELLQTARTVLSDHGMFIQVQHFLWDRKYLRMVFGQVRTAPVLLNVLPAFVYYAAKMPR